MLFEELVKNSFITCHLAISVFELRGLGFSVQGLGEVPIILMTCKAFFIAQCAKSLDLPHARYGSLRSKFPYVEARTHSSKKMLDVRPSLKFLSTLGDDPHR